MYKINKIFLEYELFLLLDVTSIYTPLAKLVSSPQSDTKCQKLLECILTRNSKLYLGNVYTKEQLAKLSEEEVEKIFNNYEAKLSDQMVHSLGHSIINTYSMGYILIIISYYLCNARNNQSGCSE